MLPIDDAVADLEHVIVSGRWANCNKEDAVNPKCCARDVAQEVNQGGEAGAAFLCSYPLSRPRDASSVRGPATGQGRALT